MPEVRIGYFARDMCYECGGQSDRLGVAPRERKSSGWHPVVRVEREHWEHYLLLKRKAREMEEIWEDALRREARRRPLAQHTGFTVMASVADCGMVGLILTPKEPDGDPEAPAG